MIHPKTELKYINATIGHGVVATEFIPAGTITWALDELDREFTPKQYASMKPLYRDILDIYSYRNNKGNYMLCWDYGRFVNHSFNSNCLSTAYDFEIAIRDIEKGEQLTDDYGYLNITEPFRGFDEGTERKIVYPDDLLTYYEIWDQQIIQVFPQILKVKQPLSDFIEKPLWAAVKDIIDGKQKMKSILDNYYRP